ncbi:MAG: helix-turn-helix transcriptional regulator, partial [Candidatus Thorarchaeota archaeon]
VFIIKYQTPNYEAAPVQSFFVQSIAIGLIGVLLGIIIAVFGPRIVYRLRRIGKVRFVGVTNEEEEVLEVIRQKGGSCPQKDLYTEFDMSQAKVSLILNNLEERGLVRRLREGRENVVHIMEN